MSESISWSTLSEKDFALEDASFRKRLAAEAKASDKASMTAPPISDADFEAATARFRGRR